MGKAVEGQGTSAGGFDASRGRDVLRIFLIATAAVLGADTITWLITGTWRPISSYIWGMGAMALVIWLNSSRDSRDPQPSVSHDK